MAKVSEDTLQQIQEALRCYEEEVDATRMMPKSKETYIRHARHFVRWLDDNFEPGSRV